MDERKSEWMDPMKTALRLFASYMARGIFPSPIPPKGHLEDPEDHGSLVPLFISKSIKALHFGGGLFWVTDYARVIRSKIEVA